MRSHAKEYCIDTLHPVLGLISRYGLKEGHRLLPKLDAKLLLLLQIVVLDEAGLPERYPALGGTSVAVFSLVLVVFQQLLTALQGSENEPKFFKSSWLRGSV